MTTDQMPREYTEFDLSVNIPSFSPSKFEIRSFTNEGNSYLLDLSAQTCTCPDFTSHRAHFVAPGHMGRYCKHLIRELHQRDAFRSANGWIGAIADTGFGGPYNAWVVSLPTAQDMLVTASYGSQWINVFARNKRSGERAAQASGRIEQFGWLPVDRRWSYGQSPPGASEIKPLLRVFENAYYEEAKKDEPEIVDWRQVKSSDLGPRQSIIRGMLSTVRRWL